MSEKLNSFEIIKNLNPEIVKKMLSFIYTDEVEVEKVENYMCATDMFKNRSVKNVMKILEVAGLYSILDLKKEVLSFVVSHRQVVKKSE